ncbi:MAG: DUF1311 domain-containing protein [Burkholderiales bacterium]|nr:DUF1311 domain-containing protein [Burkholderiales bacterium]
MPADVLEADRALNRAWRALLDARAGAPAEVALLRREQRDWLLRRDKTMRDALKDLYDERIAYVESLVQQRPAADPARREAVFGRYGERVRRCYVDGTCAGWGDSDVFILPTGKPGQARVLVDTLFFNGHSCTLDEVGTMEDGHLVVLLDSWDAARKAFVEKSCRVRIAFDPGRSLVIENPGGCDSSAYCGTRGSLYGRYPRWRAGTPARR